MDLYQELCGILGEENVFTKEPMSRHTTFRAGGPADFFVTPEKEGQVRKTLSLLKEAQVPRYIMGNGSNLLVSDAGYDGVVIHLFKNMSQIWVQGNFITAEAGALLVRVSNEACREGLAGLEFASGIPGTVGGALVMNAGAYGGEMKDVVCCVKVLAADGWIREYTGEEMDFGYRRSRIAEGRDIVLEAEFRLRPGKTEEIRARMEELREQRVKKQPLEYASAGSTFKRPEGYFAGKLIEDAGLRGFRIGDAQVSEKHCGFVINRGNATAAQIAEVIEEVKKRVYADSGVRLKTEVKYLGW